MAADNGWIAVPDPGGSGDRYFWHRPTGKTTWERPPGPVRELSGAALTADSGRSLPAAQAAQRQQQREAQPHEKDADDAARDAR